MVLPFDIIYSIFKLLIWFAATNTLNQIGIIRLLIKNRYGYTPSTIYCLYSFIFLLPQLLQ
jgi:hypothetical protein